MMRRTNSAMMPAFRSAKQKSRDAGQPKKYVGNLKTVQAKEQTQSASVKKTAPVTESFDDLPF